ncbi:MAG: CBS domain-containing protein [Burkholderiales bacterium]|nr:CBS domain-containing protein [Burkholderiales bacterium]
MPVGELCIRETIVVGREESALEVARLMRRHHVGDVVVVDEIEGRKIPVGIVTDRDLVVEIMAMGILPEALSAGEIMSDGLATIGEERGVFEAIGYMRSLGVRRLPVVDEKGALIGILTLDDLLELLAEELSDIARLLKCERRKEMRRRA